MPLRYVDECVCVCVCVWYNSPGQDSLHLYTHFAEWGLWCKSHMPMCIGLLTVVYIRRWMGSQARSQFVSSVLM